MTEVEKMFHDDIREKKSIKNSANKTNRTGKGPIRFPSDYLSKKEKRALNGECSTWNLNGFYSWDEFKRMPDDIKISWLNRMLNVYGIGIANIEAVVFNGRKKILSNWLDDHPEIRMYVNVPPRGGRRSKTAVEKFAEAVEEWRTPKSVDLDELTEEEQDYISGYEGSNESKDFTEEEKKFISTYLAPISEPKEDAPVNMINPDEKTIEIPAVDAPRMNNMDFSMDGFDFDFLRMIAKRFGDQKIRVNVSVYVEKSINE